MKKWLTLFTMTSLLASPALGSVREAAFGSSADRRPTETSMFVGINYRVAIDRNTNAREARASFKVARMVRTPNAQFRVAEGFALAAGREGRPALLVGSQEIGAKDAKANLGTGGTVAIVAVGLLAVGAVAAYYALRDPCDHKECE